MEKPESSISSTVIRFKVKSPPSRRGLHARDRSCGRRRCRSKKKLDKSNNGELRLGKVSGELTSGECDEIDGERNEIDGNATDDKRR
ncbi:hypothetical protein YC2023_118121 [Brassica napus]